MSKDLSDEARLWAVDRFLRAHKIGVRLDPQGENLIRSARLGDTPGLCWVIEVQGWPNLVHELAHLLQAGQADEDSGFAYERVPLDLANPQDRGYLWDELCACALSCAWSGPRGGDSARREEFLKSWFREQVEILPVFYGAGSGQAFAARVGELLVSHDHELKWAQARLWALARRLCEPQGLGPGRKGEDDPLSFPGRGTATHWMTKARPWPWINDDVPPRERVAWLWERYVGDQPLWSK